VVSDLVPADSIVALIKAGVKGYLFTSDVGHVAESVRELVRGGLPMSGPVSNLVLGRARRPSGEFGAIAQTTESKPPHSSERARSLTRLALRLRSFRRRAHHASAPNAKKELPRRPRWPGTVQPQPSVMTVRPSPESPAPSSAPLPSPAEPGRSPPAPPFAPEPATPEDPVPPRSEPPAPVPPGPEPPTPPVAHSSVNRMQCT
jgi:hypothetical protein